MTASVQRVWPWLVWLAVAGATIHAHGCHSDADTELFARWHETHP